MFSRYQLSPLEEWLESYYMECDIRRPRDLTIKNVASAFDVKVIVMDDVIDQAIWDDEISVIFLNSSHGEHKRKELFFHELPHPLLHIGDQMMLPKTFRDLQETQANRFQLYAAIPFFMLKNLEIPNTERQFYDLLSYEFGVSIRFAQRRIEQIKRRISQIDFDKSMSEYFRLQFKSSCHPYWI